MLPRRRVPELVGEVVADVGGRGPSIPVTRALTVGPAAGTLQLEETAEGQVMVVEAKGFVAVVPEMSLEARRAHEVAIPDDGHIPV